jgi:hypothetical protein
VEVPKRIRGESEWGIRKVYRVAAERVLGFFPVGPIPRDGVISSCFRNRNGMTRAQSSQGCADSQTVVESEVGSAPKGTEPLFYL